ncbi:MAG: hypothetical protein ACJ8KA_09670 [Sulfurifustis sp.]
MKTIFAVIAFCLATAVLSVGLVHSAEEQPTAAEKTLDLTQKTVDRLLVEHLTRLPRFLIHPRATFADIFKSEPSLADAIVFAAVMTFIGIAVAFALKITAKIELSSIGFVYVGNVVLWIIYAVFMHGFAVLFGSERGIEYTIAAYLYAVGYLQPVLAILLFGLSQMTGTKVDYREIRSLGGSGSALLLARGNFVPGNTVFLYRAIAGLLILIYFALALAEAQQIGLLRASLASAASLLCWFVFFAIVYLISKALANGAIGTALVRMFEG